MSEKEARKRSSGESQKEDGAAPHPYVVPESEIRGLVGSLDIRYLSIVAARFQIVADLTNGAFEENIDRLDESDLMLIKQLAAEDNSKYYRRIMRAIIAGLGQGRHGINAAHLTASLAVLMTFRWSPEHRFALDGYRHRLRRDKRNPARTAVAPRLKRDICLANPNDQVTKTQRRRSG